MNIKKLTLVEFYSKVQMSSAMLLVGGTMFYSYPNNKILVAKTTTNNDIRVFYTRKITWDNVIDYHCGAHIQDAMPQLSPDEREFILTGITPEEWDELFSEE